MAKAFSQFGIEIECMIVDRKELNLLPVSDSILKDKGGAIVNSLRQGPITWSNELVMHVLEFKTSHPVKSMDGLVDQFHESMLLADRKLKEVGGGLLGTAMHPWFDPFDGVELWTYEDREIYDALDRIFDSRGHGWSNLQSFHLNLPFEIGHEDQFRRLHSAIRLVLPFVPALAASSPFFESSVSGMLDTRLKMYRQNCIRIPSISGGVIPDVYTSESDYQERVFDVIAKDLEPHDPEGILEPEWTNARGAIARFDRGSIEIRVGDSQECPAQDLAIIQMLIHLVKDWFYERDSSLDSQEQVSTEVLRRLLDAVIIDGGSARLEDPRLLRALGVGSGLSVGEWLVSKVPRDSSWKEGVETILEHGNLAERLLKSVGRNPQREQLLELYKKVRLALLENRPFVR